MVFNATFNNILAISWRSVLLVEEIGGPGENHQPVASHWQTLSHNVVHLALIEIRTHYTSVLIGTDCVGNCKFNYHTIMTTTATSHLKLFTWQNTMRIFAFSYFRRKKNTWNIKYKDILTTMIFNPRNVSPFIVCKYTSCSRQTSPGKV